MPNNKTASASSTTSEKTPLLHTTRLGDEDDINSNAAAAVDTTATKLPISTNIPATFYVLSGVSQPLLVTLLKDAGLANSKCQLYMLFYYLGPAITGLHMCFSEHEALPSTSMTMRASAIALFDITAQALNYTGAALAGPTIFAIVYSSVTVWTAVFSWLVLRRTLIPAQWMGIITVFGGLVLTATDGSVQVGSDVARGLLLVLLGSAMHGLTYVLCETVMVILPHHDDSCEGLRSFLMGNPRDKRLTVLQNCAIQGIVAVVIMFVWQIIYTAPRYDELILEPMIQAHTTKLHAALVLGFFALSNLIHALSYFYTLRHFPGGATSAGVMKGLQAVLVFVVTDFFFCGRTGGTEMCFSTTKFVSLVTVVGGIILYGVFTEKQHRLENETVTLPVEQPLHDSIDKESKEFDFIIVGAGPSAIGLLTSLLENRDRDVFPSIAIVERGPQTIASSVDRGPSKTQHLSRWFEAAHDRSSSYVQVVQSAINTQDNKYRRLDIPIGRGIGGGSNINAGLCVAPPPGDFQNWSEPYRTGLPDILEHLQERLCANHCLWNSANGKEITNTRDLDDHAVPCLGKVNPHNSQIGRVNYYNALLEPILQESSVRAKNWATQVHWFCHHEAQRLILLGERVTGIEVCNTAAGSYYILSARNEVIICAGALETPALLLASGVGPDDAATSKNSNHRIHGVGKRLRDHVILPRVLLGPPPSLHARSINGIHGMTSFEVPGYSDRFLLMTATTVPEIALHFFGRIIEPYWRLVSSRLLPCWLNNQGWPVLEGFLKFAVMYTPVYWFLQYGVTTMNLAYLNPHSTGSLRLVPKHSFTADDNTTGRRRDFDLQLDLKYLRDPKDIQSFWRGWVASPIVSNNSSWWEVYPGIIFRFLYRRFGSAKFEKSVPSWFDLFSRDTCLPFYHWCGTCAIKTTNDDDDDSDDWVVDADLKVRSLRCLRICDASIFPNNLSVPPALACVSIGYLLGKMLCKDSATKKVI